MSETYDAIVIGAGSGGLTVAVGLVGFGKRVALVEADRVGGDCTNVGCIPSKRLIHLSRGLDAGRDPAAVLAAVRATRDGLAEREAREMQAAAGIDLIRARAALLAPGRVRTTAAAGSAREITARHVIVATGSRPRTLRIPGLPEEALLTNETLFELVAAPSHLAIVGAGAIGLEMACAFRRLGSRVTVIDAERRVLAGAPAVAGEVVAAALAEQGIELRLGTRTHEYDAATRTLVITDGAPARLSDVDRVLVAIGREPNLEVVAGQVATGPAGIVVDAWGRTSAKGVWAVGDVTPLAHQTHAANAYGRRIVQRIALPWLPAPRRPPLIPNAVFSDPEVAWVGPSEAELARRCHPDALTHLRVELARTDRGLTDGVRHGFVAIDAVRLTGRIVAATAVGPGASEMIATLTLAIERRISLLRLQRQVWAYPTFSGAIGALADQFARQTLPRLGPELRAYARHRFARARLGRS